MKDAEIYAPPKTDLITSDPGDDGPLPWEDPAGYPTLGRRFRRTVVCFFKRPVWFFARIGKGPDSLAKPFQFFLVIWSPLTLLMFLMLAIGTTSLIKGIQAEPRPGWAPPGFDNVEIFPIFGLFPLWYFGVLLAWGLAIHSALRAVTKQAIGTMASTLRAAAYCAPILVPFVVLNLSLHEQSFYILGTAVPLAALLIPGLAKMHGLSKWRTAAAVILALGVMAPLSWYAHNDLLTHLKEAVLEFKGWAT